MKFMTLMRMARLVCSTCCKNFYRLKNKIRKNTVKHYCSEYCRVNGVKWTNLNCLKCGKDFPVPPNQKNRAKYCSKECMKSKIKCVCQTCGKWFYRQLNQIRNGEGKYCSRPCRFTGLKRNCATCKKEFYVPKYRMNDPIRGKYCGKKCRYFKLKKICVVCGKKFIRSRAEIIKKGGKFCAQKCYWAYGRIVVNCSECGKEYKVWKTHYERGAYKQCSDKCRAKRVKSPLKALIRTLSKYKQWRISVFQRDKYACQAPNCAVMNGRLEAHHIIAFDHLLRINNINSLTDALKCPILWDRDNGMTLCSECHAKTTNYGNLKNRISKEFFD